MDNPERTQLDALLNLLADAVAKRIDERSALQHAESEPSSIVPSVPVKPAAPEATPASSCEPAEAVPESAPERAAEQAWEATPEAVLDPTSEQPEEDLPDLAPSPSSHAASLMARLAIGILLIVALINVPLNTRGTALARSIPSSASLVIANGLVVKEATSPDIWVYRDGAFHWITSLDAFNHFGYQWQQVHMVEPGFLNQFPKGSPMYVLLKCDASPHIYRLEDGRKRWIVDIATFTAEGSVWQDVEFVSCSYLHNLPDGDSIPPGRGLPPPPLP